MSTQKFRLVTRSDFDGLVCAVLLKDLGLINEVFFTHPKDVQDGKVAITKNDITTNLPFSPHAHLVFDHHFSELLRNSKERPKNYIIDGNVPSAARVVYNYYGGKTTFPNINSDIMYEVDKADTAQYNKEEILHPQLWVLLNFVMDPRTGLGRFKNYGISNYNLMMNLIDACHTKSIVEILQMPTVLERTDLYFSHEQQAVDQIHKCTKVYNNLVVLDLREEKIIWCTNRFMIYALYPLCNVSMHVMWGVKKQNTVFAMGGSIIDRSMQLNLGNLALQYGGGGHQKAATCQVSNENADKVKEQLIAALSANV